jgi:iron complex transport system substrate-binding protein
MGRWSFDYGRFLAKMQRKKRRGKGFDVEIDELSGIVVDECIAIHRRLGPGLFEAVYETILAGRREAGGLKVQRQFPVALIFDDKKFETAFRVDIFVDCRLVLAIKAVEQLTKAHARPLLTYLRILQQSAGLLLNFRERR